MTAALQNLEQLWLTTIPTKPPTQDQWFLWAGMHDPDTLRYALVETAKKASRMGGKMTQDHAIRFMSSVMNNRETRN